MAAVSTGHCTERRISFAWRNGVEMQSEVGTNRRAALHSPDGLVARTDGRAQALDPIAYRGTRRQRVSELAGLELAPGGRTPSASEGVAQIVAPGQSRLEHVEMVPSSIRRALVGAIPGRFGVNSRANQRLRGRLKQSPDANMSWRTPAAPRRRTGARAATDSVPPSTEDRQRLVDDQPVVFEHRHLPNGFRLRNSAPRSAPPWQKSTSTSSQAIAFSRIAMRTRRGKRRTDASKSHRQHPIGRARAMPSRASATGCYGRVAGRRRSAARHLVGRIRRGRTLTAGHRRARQSHAGRGRRGSTR